MCFSTSWAGFKQCVQPRACPSMSRCWKQRDRCHMACLLAQWWCQRACMSRDPGLQVHTTTMLCRLRGLDHPALQVTASARQVNAPDLPVPSPTPLSCQTHQWGQMCLKGQPCPWGQISLLAQGDSGQRGRTTYLPSQMKYQPRAFTMLTVS